MTRQEQKENTCFNCMVKKFKDALIAEAETAPQPPIKYSEDAKWAADRFGINPADFYWYHSGTCYDRIAVLTEEAAKKVGESVAGQTANGGVFHGMPLGGYSKYTNDKGITYYDVYC